MSLRTALVLVLVLGGAAATARAFSLIDFPDQTEIDSGLVRRWTDYLADPGQPFVMTYAIDSAFLAGEDPETVAAITATIEAALQSWTDATNGLMQFEPAAWLPFRNEGNQPPSQFVGPSLDEWLICAEACAFDSQCIGENCPSPGWGAHIDFFSESTGYTISTGGVVYEMDSCNLAFTAVHRIGATEIVSCDIYLNSDWNWTIDEAQANPISEGGESGLQRIPLSCGCSHDAAFGGSVHAAPDRADCSSQQASSVIDLQTVLVHEIGHALGLDHPNEAVPAGSPNLDPYVFEPGFPLDSSVVMYGGYDGVKRVLTEDDLGGIAYLYPPALYGDITADGSIDFLDAFRALDIFEGRVAPDPWSVNRLDYNTRNGRIDMDELQQLLLWVVDPLNHPPGQVPSGNGSLWESGVAGPTTINVFGTTDPSDIGVGGVVNLVLEIDNPDQRLVQGWDFRIQYQSDVLLNPRYGTDRTFLENSSLIPISVTPLSPGLSELRVGSLGFDPDSATQGVLVNVLFDIDLAAAAPVSQVDFTFDEAISEIVVALPYSHGFSKDPNFPDETLNYLPVSANAFLLDVDANGIFDLNDLYAYPITPVDVNYDLTIDEIDRSTLNWSQRRNELEDVAGKFFGQGPLPSVEDFVYSIEDEVRRGELIP